VTSFTTGFGASGRRRATLKAELVGAVLKNLTLKSAVLVLRWT
jgi:hypothetical protein